GRRPGPQSWAAWRDWLRRRGEPRANRLAPRRSGWRRGLPDRRAGPSECGRGPTAGDLPATPASVRFAGNRAFGRRTSAGSFLYTFIRAPGQSAGERADPLQRHPGTDMGRDADLARPEPAYGYFKKASAAMRTGDMISIKETGRISCLTDTAISTVPTRK